MKKLLAVEKFWASATFHDRVLALNTINIVCETAKEYADMVWGLLPEDVQKRIVDGAK